MRLLLSGDIHIGRTSTRLPPGAGTSGFRAADAWERMVELAIEERVAVVLLSGDVTDQENGFWEAVGPLERGIARLARHGIRTVAVAGNHDFGVLGRLAESLDPTHFTLIGRGGRWERLTIEEAGRPLLHIDGWSFPNERAIESPLGSYALPADASAPILGMVHGDLDVAGTLYAPLQLQRLRERPPQGWLLGHVHRPRLIDEPSGAPWVLYPGSPQALDPGEEGIHGPWLLEIEEGHLGIPRQRPLSSVVYGQLDVDVTGVTSIDRLEPHLNAAIHAAVTGIVERIERAGGSGAGQIVLRLRAVGATALAEKLIASLDALGRAGSRVIADREVSVDRITNATTPAIDLRDAARSVSALGSVARLALQLDEDGPAGVTSPTATSATSTSAAEAGGKDFHAEIERLVDEAQADLKGLCHTSPFTLLGLDLPSREGARVQLRAQARRLLVELAGQLPASPPDEVHSPDSSVAAGPGASGVEVVDGARP